MLFFKIRYSIGEKSHWTKNQKEAPFGEWKSALPRSLLKCSKNSLKNLEWQLFSDILVPTERATTSIFFTTTYLKLFANSSQEDHARGACRTIHSEDNFFYKVLGRRKELIDSEWTLNLISGSLLSRLTSIFCHLCKSWFSNGQTLNFELPNFRINARNNFLIKSPISNLKSTPFSSLRRAHNWFQKQFTTVLWL